MHKNVGDLDAYLRITGGFTLLGMGILDRSRFTIMIGAMKVAEGMTRFCPMLHMLGMNTLNDRLEHAESDVARHAKPETGGVTDAGLGREW